MRTPLVVGNWKMHGTIAESRALATGIRDGLKRPRGVDVVVCPPFTALMAVAEIVGGTPIGLGGQNCHHEPSGAHTGEISPTMLVDVGCRLVLVGHSERRREMGEIDEQVNRKLRAALAHGLTPVLCVGETAEERRQGLTFTTVEGQLRAGLAGIESSAIGKVVLAYEPVWAIGTGEVATPADAQEVCGALRARLAERFGPETANNVRILYGGSVKAGNTAGILAGPDVDGALVGGASLDADEFAGICRHAADGS
jgi:triosephosphate isomerase (TIM)